MEGIDESSQNDDLVPRAARTPSTAPRVGLLLFCPLCITSSYWPEDAHICPLLKHDRVGM